MKPLLLCLFVATACGDKSAPAPEGEPPDSRLLELAREACACKDLECMDARQRVLRNMLEATHDSQAAVDDRELALARVSQCTDELAVRLETEINALAADLCACPDRACYEALRPRVDQVFSRDNAADIGPAMLARIRAATDRFAQCDERFSAPLP